MLKNEALKEVDAHLSSLSSAAHSKLSMPDVKTRRRELHVWRAEIVDARDGDPQLEEIVRRVYETDPVRFD
ncbi:hypothetical protein G3I13_05910 [Streptomyces sp. SID6673]|nr:hypothetical protein [Streptomyces sp. SID11726]NEB23862.1 hypothetical protein [Streptomyces sp. SID6673]